MSAEEREAIDGRFVRGSAGLTSPHRGSGIGLSMVQLLIKAMGGWRRRRFSAAAAAVAGGGGEGQGGAASGWHTRETTEAASASTDVL